MEWKKMKCTKCGYINKDSNFCINCGSKLKEVCNCWIKKEPYNCGEEQCPSYRIYKKTIDQK